MPRQYSVLLLMTDQHRWDALGCYGNKVIQSPNLDRLAGEGTRFSHMYSAVPSCIPARASLMTGLNQWNTGILGMGRGQKRMGTGFQTTIPQELVNAGYQAVAVGKMHFSPQRALLGFEQMVIDESSRKEDPGFISDYEAWFNKNKDGDYGIIDKDMDWNGWQSKPYQPPERLHPTTWTADRAVEFLQTRDNSRPFFLKVSFARPHSPYDAIERWFSYYRERELPGAFVGDWASMNDIPQDAQKKSAWRGKMSTDVIHAARAGYYGNVSYIDEQIGRIIALLKEQGEYDNCLILFTSDHGDMLGDHHMWRKTYAYEGSAHIPLLIKLPQALNLLPTPVVSQIAELRDIMPTILDILGLPIPSLIDGRSLYPLMRGDSVPWREYLHGEHCTCYSEDQEMQYLTDGKTKYIWLPRLNLEQLFDLEKDPTELHDLAHDSASNPVLLHWRERLILELEGRGHKISKNGLLVNQRGKKPFVSPKYAERTKKTQKKHCSMVPKKKSLN